MSDNARAPIGKTLIEDGFASRPHPGESVSGDGHVVAPCRHGVLVGVVDGLGHGSEAARATKIATETLRRLAGESVISLVRHCHEALHGTRGVAVSIASLDALEDTMAWISVGNVEGRLIRAEAAGDGTRESVLLRGGVVGFQLPPLRASVLTVSPADLLLFATDGVRHGFDEGVIVSDPPQKIAESILDRHAKGTDDALILAVRYLGAGR